MPDMRYLLLLMFLFLSNITATSQEKEQLSFTGKLLMNDFSSISYRLNLSFAEFGAFTGISSKEIFIETPRSYSSTGYIDLKLGKISFIEHNPISKKSSFEHKNECFVQVSNANLKLVENKIVLEGIFQSNTLDGELCFKGKIKLAGPVTPYISEKLGNQKISTTPLLLASESDSLHSKISSYSTLTKDSVKAIVIPKETRYIFIDLWDEEVEDGDIIDIYLNDALIKGSIQIKKLRQRLKIPIEADELTLKILAKNTGRIFPNTVSILVICKKNSYQIETKLKKNESASILIKFST